MKPRNGTWTGENIYENIEGAGEGLYRVWGEYSSEDEAISV